MSTTTFAEYAAQQEARQNIALAVLGHTYALCEALRQNYIDYSIRSHQKFVDDADTHNYHKAQIALLMSGISDYNFYPETGKKYHKIVMDANGSPPFMLLWIKRLVKCISLHLGSLLPKVYVMTSD